MNPHIFHGLAPGGRHAAEVAAGPGRPALRPRRRPFVAGALVVLAALVAVRLWPHAPLSARIPTSTAVWSADGVLLRVTLTADEQYRMWVPLDEVSPTLTDAFLLKEDRWFFWHPGINPPALVRAIVATYVDDDRQGGSTITMQLARLVYGLNTRSPSGKATQITAALWLELRYSKRQILEAYLNAVPFGGNIQGVAAASRLYFGKPPDRLNLAEAITLAVIPQRPASRAGGATSTQHLLAARARLGAEWLATHGNAADERRQIQLPLVAQRAFSMPRQAPHFVDALLSSRRTAASRIDTTLDLQLQQLVELQVSRYLAGLADVGVHNATALLVDTRDTSVKAWVGSADYWNEDIDGQVNGVLARRSPGSALKPFIYGLAFDQGVIHPQTVLRDAPTAFGPFSPENFDGAFFGPVTAQDALIRSRNVPAVWVTTQLSQPTLYDFLRTAGVRKMKPESFYGLALALGGGEVSMEELAELYAMLANDGVLHRLRVDSAVAQDEGVRLLSPEASFMTLDVLRRNPRPDGDGMVPARTRWPVAWKTGTSWGFRDAWSAGIVGPYALVVWVGNFDGRGNPAFIGVDAAAPLFFRIADALNLARGSEVPAAPVPPAGVSRIAVCTGSGDLPNAACPHTVDTWYIPGKSPIRVSQLHRAMAIDAQTGRAVCPPYPASTRFEVFEFWTSDMLELFRHAGMPRRVPPPLPDCAAADDADAPRISSPLRNVSYALGRASSSLAEAPTFAKAPVDKPADRSDQIMLEAGVSADVRRVFWFDGRALIGARAVSDGAMPWRPETPGVHLIRVVDDQGRSAERDVDIQFTQ